MSVRTRVLDCVEIKMRPKVNEDQRVIDMIVGLQLEAPRHEKWFRVEKPAGRFFRVVLISECAGFAETVTNDESSILPHKSHDQGDRSAADNKLNPDDPTTDQHKKDGQNFLSSQLTSAIPVASPQRLILGPCVTPKSTRNYKHS